MPNEIDWQEIKVGEKYMYEEKYYLQAEVTVLKDTSPEGINNYKQFQIKIDKPVIGCEKEQVITVGKIVEGEGLYLVNGMKFKPLGSMFDYSF